MPHIFAFSIYRFCIFSLFDFFCLLLLLLLLSLLFFCLAFIVVVVVLLLALRDAASNIFLQFY